MVERKVEQKLHSSTAMLRQVLKVVPVSSWWMILCEALFEIQVTLDSAFGSSPYCDVE